MKRISTTKSQYRSQMRKFIFLYHSICYIKHLKCHECPNRSVEDNCHSFVSVIYISSSLSDPFLGSPPLCPIYYQTCRTLNNNYQIVQRWLFYPVKLTLRQVIRCCHLIFNGEMIPCLGWGQELLLYDKTSKQITPAFPFDQDHQSKHASDKPSIDRRTNTGFLF